MVRPFCVNRPIPTEPLRGNHLSPVAIFAVPLTLLEKTARPMSHKLVADCAATDHADGGVLVLPGDFVGGETYIADKIGPVEILLVFWPKKYWKVMRQKLKD